MANNRELSQFASTVGHNGGKVGINTTNPTARLEIVDSKIKTWTPTSQTELLVERNGNCLVSIIGKNDSNTVLNFGDSDDENAGAIDYDHADDSMGFRVNGSEKLNISSTGRISQIGNNEDIDMDANASGQLKLDGNGYNAGLALNAEGLNIYTNSASRGIIFGTNETERVRFTSAGSVGIGTDTPGAILEVFDATSNTIVNVKSGDSGAVLNLIDDSARSSIEQNGTTLKISSDTGAEDASSDIRLQVDGSSKMIIRDSGDVVTGVPAHDNQNNTGSRTVFTVADTTNGALVHIRGQLPAAFFDISSSGIGKVFLDGADFAIQSGTPASEGTERLRITSAGNVSIQNDSGKFTAGASDDLEVYHDGSHSYVKDNGTGNLKLISNGTAVQIEKSDGENIAIFRTDGSVDLFYDNSKKFETVSNGVLASGRVFVQSTSGGFDYNTQQNTLEYIVDGSTHSELNTGAYVPQGTKNLGSNAARWQTLYLSNGIDFAANSNAAGMTSEVLDDYEEGSWTPTAKMEQAGSNASIDGVDAHYVKVGSLVHIFGQFDFNGTPAGRSTSAAVEIRDLPFAHQHGYDKISHDIRVTGWETGSTYGSDITFIMRMIANASYFRVEALQAGYNGTRNASLTVQDNTSYKFSFTYQAS